MSRVFRYPPSALYADYVRAVGGLLLTGVPLLVVEPLPAVKWILAGLFALFLVFGIRTLIRQLSRVELTSSHLATLGPLARRIAWNDLSGVKLRYYSTRRKKDQGWMQLKVWSGRTSIAIDSSMDGFQEVAEYTAREMRARGLETDATTINNFAGLGLSAAASEATGGNG